MHIGHPLLYLAALRIRGYDNKFYLAKRVRIHQEGRKNREYIPTHMVENKWL